MSWITISPTSGCKDGTITANTSENTSSESRTGTIKVYNSDFDLEGTTIINQDTSAGTGHTTIYYTTSDWENLVGISFDGYVIHDYTMCYGKIVYDDIVKSIVFIHSSSPNPYNIKTLDGISNRVTLLVSDPETFSDLPWEYADLSNIDVSRVINMQGMFIRNHYLKTLILDGWDTSKVTNMENMFSSCNSLVSLDISGFDTSNVTIMQWMFHYCRSLTSLDLSNWDTSKVTNMIGMFEDCYSLTSLDLSNWDTRNVETMSSMFDYCKSLTSLDLSNWDTSKVTSMNSMFRGCQSLTSIDLSSFDTNSVKYFGNLFGFCHSLSSIKIGPKCIMKYDRYLYSPLNLDNMPSSGTLYYPTGMDSTQVARWTPTGWTAVAY